MVAASSSKINRKFSEKELTIPVEAIEKRVGELLQIVNFNVT